MRARWPWRSRAALAALALALVGGAFAYHPLKDDLRAAALLAQMRDPQALQPLLAPATTRVTVQRADFSTARGAIRANLYVPHGVEAPPAMVVVHGVHHLGMAEPRLVRFAETMANRGILVLTPELQAIAGYRVDTGSVEEIGAAAHALRQRTGRRVGLMGLSFSGGLALVAAADPRWSPDIAFVLAVGAHHSLARVLRFYATNQIPRPDGSIAQLQAHEYGALIVAYSQAEEFFGAADAPAAAAALHSWLREKPDEARTLAAQLSPPARQKLESLFAHKLEALAPLLERLIASRAQELDAASPAGRLAQLRMPVLLLHGYGDNVIPPTETLWLAQEAPPALLVDSLVSRAVSHVSVEGEPTLADQWRLIDFVSHLLHQAELTKE